MMRKRSKKSSPLEDFDGKASSNRLVIGGVIAGRGATMIGGEFSAKILLNGKDNGKQEYINPDMMESLASCTECPPPPNQALEAVVTAGGAAGNKGRLF
jgi:hypothetical protein